MPDTNLNILKIRVSNTSLKTLCDNLEVNQNSENNRLYLYCEADYDFVECTYIWPDGRKSYIHHMIPNGYNNEEAAYEFYDDIPKAVLSFTIPAPTAQLLVSFIGYTTDEYDRIIANAINDTVIVVKRVNNSDAIDFTYLGSDVPKIWTELGNIKNNIKDLDVTEANNKIDELAVRVSNNYTELNSKIEALPTFNDVYTKSQIDNKLTNIYKYKGSVSTFNNLPNTGLTTGDVYNVESDGMNYAWNGTSWDSLGATSVDLTGYYTKQQIDSKINVINASLSTNETNIASVSTNLSNFKTSTNTAIASINTALANKVNTSDVYTKSEVDNKVSTVYKYKGSVSTIGALPTNPAIGDVYNVVGENGSNYAWDGTQWDNLGGTIDLSSYATKAYVDNKTDNILTTDNVYTKQQIDSKISNINQTTTTLTGRVDSLAGSINTINTELAGKASTTSLNNVASNVNTLQTSVTNIQSSINSINTTISDHSTRITKLENKTQSVYKYKGNKPTYNDLPTDASVGDVWNVEANGMNYAWDGNNWDALGGSIDTTGFVTTETFNTSINSLNTRVSALENGAISSDNYYNKTQINDLLETKVNVSNGTAYRAQYANGVVSADSSTKFIKFTTNDTADVNTYNISNYYTKQQVDDKVANVSVNLDNYYTSTQTDSKIDEKINALIGTAPDTLNTIEELASAVTGNQELINNINSAITNKADKTTVYTKDEIDGFLAVKANTSTTYTKDEVNNLLANVSTTSVIIRDWSK